MRVFYVRMMAYQNHIAPNPRCQLTGLNILGPELTDRDLPGALRALCREIVSPISVTALPTMGLRHFDAS